MQQKWGFLGLCLSLSGVAHAELTFEQALKQNCHKIKNYAVQGKKQYDQKKYIQALKSFENQASWSSFCEFNKDESGIKLTQRDVELAYNNVGLTYAKLNKPQWAHVWYLVYPESQISQTNLKQLHIPQNTKKITGTYVQNAGFGAWNTVTVTQQKNHYAITYEGLYMTNRSLINGPNFGSFETTMPLNNTKTEFRENECKIDIRFGFNTKVGQHAILTQHGSDFACGFGHNVSAEGQFIKVE